jgi:hypothetical protein
LEVEVKHDDIFADALEAYRREIAKRVREEYVPVSVIAERAKMTRSSIYARIESGKLEALRYRGRKVVRVADAALLFGSAVLDESDAEF